MRTKKARAPVRATPTIIRQDCVGVAIKPRNSDVVTEFDVRVVHPDGRVLSLSTDPKGLMESGPVKNLFAQPVQAEQAYDVVNDYVPIRIPADGYINYRIQGWYAWKMTCGLSLVAEGGQARPVSRIKTKDGFDYNEAMLPPSISGRPGEVVAWAPPGATVFQLEKNFSPKYTTAVTADSLVGDELAACQQVYDLLKQADPETPASAGRNWPCAVAYLGLEEALSKLNPVKTPAGASPVGGVVPSWLGTAFRSGKNCQIRAIQSNLVVEDGDGVALAVGKKLTPAAMKLFSSGVTVPAGTKLFEPDLDCWRVGWMIVNSVVVGNKQLFPVTDAPITGWVLAGDQPCKTINNWRIYPPVVTKTVNGRARLLSDWTTSDVGL